MNQPDEAWLRRAVARAHELYPMHYLASLVEGDADRAATILGCTPLEACWVLLCLMPVTPAHFQQIARRCGMDEARIRALFIL